jgi:probable rRNA maturation factor
MYSIRIKTASHYPINRKQIKNAITKILIERLVKDGEVSIAIVGDRQMRKLNKQYRNKDATTDVLSFPQHDPSQKTFPFYTAPNNILYLGDIVVSYPQAVKEAAREHMMVDDKILQLILHGLDHLMGIHHE